MLTMLHSLCCMQHIVCSTLTRIIMIMYDAARRKQWLGCITPHTASGSVYFRGSLPLFLEVQMCRFQIFLKTMHF